MKNRKRILLVDDEKTVLYLIGESLKKVSDLHEIITATSGKDALEIFRNSKFDLVLTDIMMPEMDGVSLTEEIRKLNQKVTIGWITAYGTPELQAQAQTLGVEYFLTKPLHVNDIRHIAQSALNTIVSHQTKELVQPGQEKQLQTCLTQLQVETRAHLILLTTTTGNPVDMVGATAGMDIQALSALVAANFLAAHEISRLLGRESDFKLSYHQSDQHNVYAYSVTEKYLLITVFGEETKPGVVWFYAQRAVTELRKILANLKFDDRIENSIMEELNNEIQHELEEIFGSNGGSVLPVQKTPDTEEAKEVPENSNAETFSFSEAVAQGLIQDADMLERILNNIETEAPN